MARNGLPLDVAVAPDLHLHGLEAVGTVPFHLGDQLADAFAFRIEPARGVRRHAPSVSAQEPPHRHARHLAAQIPERDVYAAHGGDEDPAARVLVGSLVHAVPQPFDIPRVLSHQVRPELPFDHDLGRRQRSPEVGGFP